ncbi:MAG: 2-isopropylmalate synthase [Lentisphaeria bacterium]|nr:2-isopropylmalate synthase [Lentisphaeria bacterium]
MNSKIKHHFHIEILDTTLRDGEQTPGVSFSPQEKLEIARLLLSRLKVDRLELASAGVSEGEEQAVREIIRWAVPHGFVEQLEILGFIDNGKSVAWIEKVGGKSVNFVAKGSVNHCKLQLRKTPGRHIDDVVKEIRRAADAGLNINLYLEAWSEGMKQDFSFICDLIRATEELPVKRVMPADTLGLLSPEECGRYAQWMLAAFPGRHFDFHGHNDYGLVNANSLAAVNAGFAGVHTTINGLGERAGNLPLAQFVVALHDFTRCRTRIVEKELQHASQLIQSLSGKRCPWNMPVVGSDVYTHTCGVHADGDQKGGLYGSKLRPERFGRQRDIALGKLAGRASIEAILDETALSSGLTQEQKEYLLSEIIRLGDKKKTVSAADLPYIIAGVKKTPMKKTFQIKAAEFTSALHGMAHSRVAVEFNGQSVEASAKGDGGYDAFVKALKKCLKEFKLSMPKLLDYEERIPPGGRTDAIVETTITWNYNGKTHITTGVDSDQVLAAVAATEKMINFMVQ